MNLDAALQTFILESRELLEKMEEALLQLENAPEDMDSINAIFRAAHTIKGSSGLFGLDYVVSFTHVAESVLDKVRSGVLKVDEPLIALFLEVGDHIGVLIDHVAEKSKPNAETDSASQALIERLNVYLSGNLSLANKALSAQSKEIRTTEKASESPDDAEAYTIEGNEEVETDCWHLSLRFGEDVFRNGMDPLGFIRYMNTIGSVVNIVTIFNQLPALSEMDAESCYLGFEISFRTDADKSEIQGIFDFVVEDSVIHILPPHSKVSEYIELIKALPNTEMKLGEILVQCGSLTEQELAHILNYQEAEIADPKSKIGEALVEQQIVQPDVINAALDKQQQVKDVKANEATLIRVDAGKLDQLINMVGELIIAGASISSPTILIS